MARHRTSQEARIQLFSFLDLLTGMVGVLMFILLTYSIQLRSITSPVGEMVVRGHGRYSDLSKVFFLEATGDLAIMVPEGLCTFKRFLHLGGGLDFAIDKKIRLLEQALKAEPGEVACIVLIRGDEGIPLRDRLTRLLKTKNVEMGVEVIADDVRTDSDYLVTQAESMGAGEKLFMLDIKDPELRNFDDLYVLDEHRQPQPLKDVR